MLSRVHPRRYLNTFRFPTTRTYTTEKPKLFRPFLFVLGCCGLTIFVAEHYREKRKRFNWSIRRRGGNTPNTPQEFWDSLPESRKIPLVLTFLNLLPFLGWKLIPHLVYPHFGHVATSGKSYTLLTS
eukprot:TRINITY_DN4002_c0_g1_i2.p2 TRINITY_DN4002_c0_g1~~TRINITY_DN4002_c0_g1_i2.p2  ORF type:complete len:127 (-),score=13.18 TRINITY_DN4002_c0_g1_i2:761-1141(-)